MSQFCLCVKDCRVAAGTMELGLGIHGEPGAHTAPLQPADGIAEEVRDGASFIVDVDPEASKTHRTFSLSLNSESDSRTG